MTQYHHLLGADDVRIGGYAAERAGEAMKSAANTIEYALQQHARALEEHQIFMRDWLDHYERVTHKGAEAQEILS